jgi:hypothetical protein
MLLQKPVLTNAALLYTVKNQLNETSSFGVGIKTGDFHSFRNEAKSRKDASK